MRFWQNVAFHFRHCQYNTKLCFFPLTDFSVLFLKYRQTYTWMSHHIISNEITTNNYKLEPQRHHLSGARCFSSSGWCGKVPPCRVAPGGLRTRPHAHDRPARGCVEHTVDGETGPWDVSPRPGLLGNQLFLMKLPKNCLLQKPAHQSVPLTCCLPSSWAVVGGGCAFQKASASPACLVKTSLLAQGPWRGRAESAVCQDRMLRASPSLQPPQVRPQAPLSCAVCR